MSTVSMALLQGGKPPADAAGKGLDGLTSKQLDQLINDHDIEVPTGWAKLKVDDKRAWLKANYDIELTDEPAAETPAANGEASTVMTGEVLPPNGPAKGGQGVVTAGAVEGEILGPDPIITIVQQIENLEEPEARKLINELREQTEFNAFKLGGVLSRMHEAQWYKPYDSFQDCLEQQYGIRYRTAMYWIQIYRALVECGVAWEKVSHIGWSKIKEIAPVLTAENVDHWIGVAGQQTTLQLIDTVKAAKKGDQGDGAPALAAPTTKTFKLHPDQRETVMAAIERAKGVAETTVDTVALEMICLEYLSEAKAEPKPAADLAGQLDAAGLDAALEAFNAAFPEVSLRVDLEPKPKEG